MILASLLIVFIMVRCLYAGVCLFVCLCVCVCVCVHMYMWFQPGYCISQVFHKLFMLGILIFIDKYTWIPIQAHVHTYVNISDSSTNRFMSNLTLFSTNLCHKPLFDPYGGGKYSILTVAHYPIRFWWPIMLFGLFK